MSALKSSVLIIGAKDFPTLDIGVEKVPDWQQNIDRYARSSIDVICVSSTIAIRDSFKNFFEILHQNSKHLKMVLMTSPTDPFPEVQTVCENFPVFRIFEGKNPKDVETDIVYALEEAQLSKQDYQLETLVKEQNEKLKNLYQDLEDRVQKRQNFLLEARRKTYIANARWESLREAMLAIYRSSNISEMETNLLASLEPTLQLSGIRIVLKPQDTTFAQQMKSQIHLSSFLTGIFRSHEAYGTVFFMRDSKLSFQRDETDFLLRVSEAISLAIDRQSKLEESETLKEQWQATFNAVSEPVALINEKYELVQTNSAFLKKANLSADQVIGQKCFKVLFQKETTCQNCELGKNFRLDNPKTKLHERSIFEVYSQQVPVEPLQTTVYVNLYHDVTEQTRMERKILESARLAEIGTIGSSIAHELNNPLGGILSFVQLIKMDLKKEDPIYEDIQTMEEGVLRCRDIVQNLLSFTRNPEMDTESEVDLQDIIFRTLKIVELQTRSRGIEVKVNLQDGKHPFHGHFNLLSQAFRNLFQISIDSIIEHSKTHRGFQGVIEIKEEHKENEYCFLILDNGLATDQSPHLGLSIAGQIFHDYGGKLEISNRQQPFRWVQISIPRPVFQA